ASRRPPTPWHPPGRAFVQGNLCVRAGSQLQFGCQSADGPAEDHRTKRVLVHLTDTIDPNAEVTDARLRTARNVLSRAFEYTAKLGASPTAYTSEAIMIDGRA